MILLFATAASKQAYFAESDGALSEVRLPQETGFSRPRTAI
jgi:hypothetical protein